MIYITEARIAGEVLPLPYPIEVPGDKAGLEMYITCNGQRVELSGMSWAEVPDDEEGD